MKKRRAVWFIATIVVLVGVIVILGYNFSISRQELTPERAKRIFLKYETELTAVAEYVSEETRWHRYYNTDVPRESYMDADFLPDTIKKNMSVYFNKIADMPLPSIYRICDESKYHFNVEPHGETGATFYMRSVDKGKDAEGCDIRISQYLVYLKSDNPELYLQQLWLGYFGSIEQIADNWYLVTKSTH